MNSHAVYFLYLCKKIVSHGILQDNHRYNSCPLNKHDFEQTIENLITIIHKAGTACTGLAIALQLLNIAVLIVLRNLFRVADRLFRHTKRNTS